MPALIESIILIVVLFLIGCESQDDQIDPILYEECQLFDGQPTKPKYHVILIIGQSNTNAGIGLDPKIDTADVRVKQLGRFDGRDFKIVEAIEPLDHSTAMEGKIGFGLTFSNLYANSYLKAGDSLFIIPCGYGGTGFKDNNWNKGNRLYKDAIKRTRFVLSNYPNSALTAILWHQGEKDVGNANYEIALSTFIEDIRTDLGYPDVPFILGGMVPFWTQQDEDRKRQQNIIASMNDKLWRTGYADPNIPFKIEKSNNSFDAFHFDANGQREIGKRYFYSFNCTLFE